MSGGDTEPSATDTPPATDAPLHLISWNVAGWKTTLEQMQRTGGGLATWLERVRVDVLCLQEVKLRRDEVAAQHTALGAGGFASYWCCNEGRGAQRGSPGLARRGGGAPGGRGGP